MVDILDMLKQMAPTGQPPTEGCRLFGVGHDEAFKKLKDEFIDGQLSRGYSAEKFVVGPYGSGKTHFLRQFAELAQEAGCATCEIRLSKDIDIRKQLLVYREIVANLLAPEQRTPGVRLLLETCVRNLQRQLPDVESSSSFLDGWISGLDAVDFADARFKRVVIKTLKAMVAQEDAVIDSGILWLEGDVANRTVCKSLNETPITSGEHDRYGRKAIFSICQLVKISGFKGTIIAYDEAEQAANVGKKKRDEILSMLRSEADAITNIRNASVFLLYAFTPDVVQEMNKYPALQQRISEPNPKYRFFDGNVHSPIIDLQQPHDREKTSSLLFLQQIGERLVNLFFDAYGGRLNIKREDLLKACYEWADEIDAKDQSIQKRRDMIKLTCSNLLALYDKGSLDFVVQKKNSVSEDEGEV